MIHPGCTEEHRFAFPYAPEAVAAVYVTYQQYGRTVLEKQWEHCFVEDGRLLVYLSQEDTLKFECKCDTRMQIRTRLTSGAVVKSCICTTITDDLLKKEVI